MKRWYPLCCAAVALALCLGLAGCDKEEETPSSSVAEESSSAATPTPSPTPTPTPDPESSFFIPAEDLIPSQVQGEPGSFEEAFSQNVIDKAYDADYAYASSFSMMRQACDVAARRWSGLIDSAFDEAMEVLDQEDRVTVSEEQSVWLESKDNRIRYIREDAGDNSEGILTAAKEIVLLYRERAMELCRWVFNATGELPAFPDLDGEPVG